MRGKRLFIQWRAILAILAVTLFASSTCIGGTADQVVHNFALNGKDGVTPEGGLVVDSGGNLYGTTAQGGRFGGGTLFTLIPPPAGIAWTEKVLHDFANDGVDGLNPYASLIFDAAEGNLFGTTLAGGTQGMGTVFELKHLAAGGWKEKVLYSFKNDGKDGANPRAALVFDTAGNLYGTTYSGGAGFGIVFELSPAGGGVWTEKILHKFRNNGTDGINPVAGLVLDVSGNLYGTTPAGGSFGFGTVFELTQTAGEWKERLLHKFKNDGIDGINPYAGVIFDFGGVNLYGTTYGGGSPGFGTVFELSPTAGGSWKETMLHKFKNDGKDGLIRKVV
ncbi:MAG: choice-of-anchor tandem repeat GloVer-containing protein [Terriglobales bacterium]